MSSAAAVVIVSLGLMLVSYLIGSVNFAILITRRFAHTDVREHGSGNAGMTNVMRTAGKIPGILTLICDFVKGAVPVLLGRFAAVPIASALSGVDLKLEINPLFFAYLGGFFCLIGHIYPLYFQFRGGKGVASLAGIMLVCDWRVMLIALAVFIVVVLLSKIVSLSSILAVITVPFTTYFLYDSTIDYAYTFFGFSQRGALTFCAALFTLILIFTHRSNIVRLVKGEEKKLTLGGKKK